MRCWIVVEGNAIAPFGNNFTITSNDSTKWTAPISYTVGREFDSSPHQFFFRHFGCILLVLFFLFTYLLIDAVKHLS